MDSQDKKGASGWFAARVSAFAEDAALNTLVGLLLLVSFAATLVGVYGFIASESGGAPAWPVAAVTGLMVFVLTIAMFVALRETLKPRRWINWPAAAAVYVLLAIWSIGFGYGFWWSLLSGPETNAREARAAAEIVRSGAAEAEARVSAAATLMESAAALSEEKARREAEAGGTCGAASAPGDGPLFRARMQSRDDVASLARAVREDWLAPLRGDLAALGDGASSLAGAPPDEFEARYDAIRSSARSIEATAGARGRAIGGELRAKAAALSGEDAACFDPGLAERLSAAANEIDRPFVIETPEIRASTGSDGVARAIESLWSAGYGLVTTGERVRFGGRDLIALLAAIGVDLSLLVFTFLQPRRRGLNAFAKRPRPEAARLEDLRKLAETAIGGREVDRELLSACFGAERDARLLNIPQPPRDSRRVEASSSLALSAFAAALADLGELRRAPPKAWKAALGSQRRLALAGWSPRALEDVAVYQGRPAMMSVYLEAALSAAPPVREKAEPEPRDETEVVLDAEIVETLEPPPARPRLSMMADDEDVEIDRDLSDAVRAFLDYEVEAAALTPDVRAALDEQREHLATRGVEILGAAGEPFDESIHEIELERSSPQPVGTVLEVIERGWRRRGDVQQKARVIISAGD